MDLLIWIGSALALIGVGLLLWCIGMVLRIRRQTLPEPEAKAALHRAVVLNMAALAVSGLGLMMVVVGVILN